MRRPDCGFEISDLREIGAVAQSGLGNTPWFRYRHVAERDVVMRGGAMGCMGAMEIMVSRPAGSGTADGRLANGKIADCGVWNFAVGVLRSAVKPQPNKSMAARNHQKDEINEMEDSP